MPRLYLHIGTPKTGTTSIQDFCFANYRALARRGYWYPVFPDVSSGNGRFIKYAAFRPDGSLETPEQERRWRRYMDVLSRGFRRHPNIVLSEEGIWRREGWPGMWRRLRREADARGFELRVIVYLRRQDRFLTSWWAQVVKTGTTDCCHMRWEEMLAQAESWLPMDYYSRLEEIAAVFGRESIDVRVYDRDRFRNRDVREDFLEAIGLSMDADFVPGDGERNPSLSGDMLEIKRRLNVRFAGNQELLSEARRVALGCVREDSQEFCMFTRQELDAFLSRYEESNRCVARDYLGSEEPLFDAPSELPPKWQADEAALSEAVFRFVDRMMESSAARFPHYTRFRHALGRWKRTMAHALAAGLRR